MSRLCEFIVKRDKREVPCALPAMNTATVLNVRQQHVKVLCCVDCYDKVRSGATPKLPHQHR